MTISGWEQLAFVAVVTAVLAPLHFSMRAP